MISLPPVSTLRAFEAAGRLKSVTAAGDELCVTQSAVSHQLRRLEEWLGTPLFVRGGRGMQLTEVGAAYWRVVSEALRTIERESQRIRNDAEDDPVIVTAPTLLASSWLVPKLEQFWVQHPDILVNVLHVGPRTRPDFDRADLAICYGTPDDWPGCHVGKLVMHGLTPACSASYLRKFGQPKDPRDLSRATLIHVGDFSEWREWFRACGIEDAYREVGSVFSTTTSAMTAAMAGKGVVLCPDGKVGSDMLADRLVRMSDIQIRTDHGAFVTWSKGRPLRPCAAKFRDWLISAFRARYEEAEVGRVEARGGATLQP